MLTSKPEIEERTTGNIREIFEQNRRTKAVALVVKPVAIDISKSKAKKGENF